MKVLLCSPLNSGGGISRWTSHVLKYYSKLRSKDVQLVHVYDKVPGVDVKMSMLSRVVRGVKVYYPMYKDVLHYLDGDDYDVFHMCSSASISLIKDLCILKAVRKRKVRTIIHFRFGRIPELFQKKNWEYRLICKVCHMADKVIVIDENSYETLKDAGFSNVILLPNILSDEVDSLVKKHKLIQREERKILFAGYLLPEKGVFELIRACKDIENIKLKLIGYVADDVKAQLQELAGDNSHEWLDIVGRVDYETVIKEMLSCGVFVLPTYTEGFPNAILESMATGCPIVTTDVGAIPEMLDIKNGFNCGICVKPKDVVGLKEALLKMLDDRQYALQCGINAQRRAKEQYSMSIIWNKLTEIWKS